MIKEIIQIVLYQKKIIHTHFVLEGTKKNAKIVSLELIGNQKTHTELNKCDWRILK